MKSRTRSLFFTGLVLLPAVFVAVLGAEIYVRWTSPYGYLTPEISATMRPLYAPAVFARHLLAPEEHGVYTQQGELLYTINALGYRGPLFTPQKPPGITRIIIYGGSSVFDHDNPGMRDWPRRVEARLQEFGFTNVEVINAGIPGHTSSDAVGRLFAEGHLFDPDYVLFYGAWNDIKDFRETKSLLRLRQPMGRADRDSPLFRYQNPVDRWLSELSQLYVRLRERYYTYGLRLGPEGSLPEGEYVSALTDTGLRQYRMNIQTFVDVARNAKATPVLLTEARLVSAANSPEDKTRIEYEMVLLTHEALVDAFHTADRILREVSQEKHVALIDPSSVLSGRAELFLDSVHLTDRGSTALADLVASSLREIIK